MSTASYAAYILHVFVVVGLQVALLQTARPPGAKFVVVSVLGLFFSFGIGHVSRFVPASGRCSARLHCALNRHESLRTAEERGVKPPEAGELRTQIMDIVHTPNSQLTEP